MAVHYDRGRVHNASGQPMVGSIAGGNVAGTDTLIRGSLSFLWGTGLATIPQGSSWPDLGVIGFALVELGDPVPDPATDEDTADWLWWSRLDPLGWMPSGPEVDNNQAIIMITLRALGVLNAPVLGQRHGPPSGGTVYACWRLYTAPAATDLFSYAWELQLSNE